jgi:hypothetical protein
MSADEYTGPSVTCGLCSLRLLGAKCAHPESPDGLARPEQCPAKPQRKLIGTCSECNSFERVDGREYGRCTNGDARTGGDYIDGIELPYADFGCIHWKERT